ncbi:MAG: fused MFS/spermidine synthase [Planctomycetota bacterium]|jgi:tetratricopeptide (TPR) repeat protein
MSKSKTFISILIPSATVFFSSGCIMVLELVAGRIIAKHLGSSLYTWTSVIGVVLAGIAIGNYLGGRIADRFSARKSLSVLFGISSAACVLVVISNNLVGNWLWLWQFSWPVRIFSHVSLVFLIPSTLLGTISPIVAKMALDEGLPAGRTVGDIYAWGAVGSIVGTFLAGFYLIAAMGTIAIIWIIGGALLVMAILYWARFWALYLWAVIFIALMTMGMVPAEWAESTGSSFALREQPDVSILYEDESRYFHIAVRQLSASPDRREFVQDKFRDSEIVMDNIRDLQFTYERIYAAVTHRLSQEKNKLSVLGIGGGGYVFPRYIEEVWPGSRVDVVEIDPAVTKAAIQAFGLANDSTINTINMDGRNYIDELLEKERAGGQIPQYDFIYGDAFNGYSVPFQLVTKEFNDRIAQILTDDGVYMINMIDVYDSGRFLGAVVNTLQRTFPNVYILSEIGYYNFVVVAAKREINLERLDTQEAVKSLDLWILSNSDIETLRKKACRVVLTDNYAPVENLVAPAVREKAMYLLAEKYLEQARELRAQSRWDESISKYKDAVNSYPTIPAKVYLEIGSILANQGRWEEAIIAAKSALEYNEKAKVKQSMSRTYHNIAFAFKKLGRNDEAAQYMRNAIEGYRQDLAKYPDSVETVRRLGNILAENGNFSEATKYFQQAVNMDPFEVKNHSLLVKALLIQKRYDEATKQSHKGIRLMRDNGQKDDAVTLERLLESVKSQKLKVKK